MSEAEAPSVIAQRMIIKFYVCSSAMKRYHELRYLNSINFSVMAIKKCKIQPIFIEYATCSRAHFERISIHEKSALSDISVVYVEAIMQTELKLRKLCPSEGLLNGDRATRLEMYQILLDRYHEKR